MDGFIQLIGSVFNLLLKPFDLLPPNIGLAIVSAVMGVLLLKLFGLVSNQKKIKDAKDQIKANLLAIAIYKDDIFITLRAQLSLLLSNLKYVLYSILPMMVLMAVCIPVLAQLNSRFGYSPIAVGQEVVLKIKASERTPLDEISLGVDPGLQVLTLPLRIAETQEVYWKLRAKADGRHVAMVSDRSGTYEKEVQVGKPGRAIVPVRLKNPLEAIIYPGEHLLPYESTVDSIRIGYPDGSVTYFGRQMHWLWPFCVISLFAGLLLKRALNVEF